MRDRRKTPHYLTLLLCFATACDPSPAEPGPGDSEGPVDATVQEDTRSAVLPVVPYGSGGYRYLDGVQGHSPVDGAGSTFEDPAFDDSAWLVGVAPFGFKGGLCAIDDEIETAGWLENHDLLVRRSFDLPAGVTELEVGVAIDNDIQVWMNGVDVSGGLQVHDGCATRDSFIFPVPPAAIRVGTNVLAIRARDRGISAFLDVEVRAASADVTPPTLIRVDVDPDTIDLTGNRDVTITIEAADDESGVAEVDLRLEAPDGSSTIDLKASFDPGRALVTHTFHQTFDEGNTRTGLWRLAGQVTDAAGNTTTVVPGTDPPVSPGVEVTFCGEDIEPRNGGKSAPFSEVQADDASFLDLVILHGELAKVRQIRTEMEEFQGWDAYLVEHDVEFRTKFCEALGWLSLARRGNEDARLLFHLTVGTLDNLTNEALLARLNYLARLRGDLVGGLDHERYRSLLESVENFDHRLVPKARDHYVLKAFTTFDRLLRQIGKRSSPAGNLVGFVKDLITIAESIGDVGDLIEFDVEQERVAPEFLELWLSRASIEGLELAYIERGTEEQRLIERLEKALRK